MLLFIIIKVHHAHNTVAHIGFMVHGLLLVKQTQFECDIEKQTYFMSLPIQKGAYKQENRKITTKIMFARHL